MDEKKKAFYFRMALLLTLLSLFSMFAGRASVADNMVAFWILGLLSAGCAYLIIRTTENKNNIQVN